MAAGGLERFRSGLAVQLQLSKRLSAAGLECFLCGLHGQLALIHVRNGKQAWNDVFSVFSAAAMLVLNLANAVTKALLRAMAACKHTAALLVELVLEDELTELELTELAELWLETELTLLTDDCDETEDDVLLTELVGELTEELVLLNEELEDELLSANACAESADAASSPAPMNRRCFTEVRMGKSGEKIKPVSGSADETRPRVRSYDKRARARKAACTVD